MYFVYSKNHFFLFVSKRSVKIIGFRPELLKQSMNENNTQRLSSFIVTHLHVLSLKVGIEIKQSFAMPILVGCFLARWASHATTTENWAAQLDTRGSYFTPYYTILKNVGAEYFLNQQLTKSIFLDSGIL